ncbi:MAG: histidinol-phosphate transaminase [Angustibacter sp.]
MSEPDATTPDAEPEVPVHLRATLDAIPAYVPGKPAPAQPGVTTYKLSSNENPYPPLPAVQAVVEQAAASMNRYPDMFATGLVQAIADHVGVAAECVATGTGSVGVLGQIVAATCGEGDEVVFAWRSFEAYPIVAHAAGAVPVPVPLRPDARHDLPAMADAVTDRTRLVLVCTPNNPTGPVVHRDELEAFLARVPRDVLVVIDEAYVEFVRDPQAPDALALYREHPNVAVLRTFSKAYGLAGLRVGYAVAHPRVAGALRKTAVPFGVSNIAQEAAIASLGASAELAERVKALVAERERVSTALAEQGWELPESQANFVWFGVGERTPDFAAACEAHGLVVRPYATDGVRVTIGEAAANDRLIEVARQFRQQEVANG